MNRGSWGFSILVACVLGLFGGVEEGVAQFTDCSAITGMPQAECQALVDLYDGTNGASWTTKTGWKQTTTPCTWAGVTCSGGHVTVLSRSSNNLVGTIPASIGNLTNLTNLNLSLNRLIGTMPDVIGTLTGLTVLALNDNGLSGSIPESFGNLVNLTNISIYKNALSGEIPPSLCNLTKLSYFGLSINYISGAIPSCIGNMPALSDVQWNRNLLTGSIPPSLGNFKGFRLKLENNFFSGVIPPELGQASNLQFLGLSGPDLSGQIPTSLCNLSKLILLYIYDTKIEGQIPECMSNLMNLNYLYLNNNRLTGEIPESIGNLNLFEFYLNNNRLTGEIPGSIGNLTNLTYLNLNNNQLSGSIPLEIGNLTRLNYLYLNNNQLSGSIPPEIGNLTRLNYLYLNNNQLSGSIPSQIGNIVGEPYGLGQLRLNNNQLSGSVPIEIGNLTKLTTLYLHTNQLSGRIPSELGNLSNLLYLYLDNNQFSGTLPNEIGNLGKLQELSVANNRITQLPDLGELTKITQLGLQRNLITGSIPSWISNFYELSNLDISHNSFSGELPLWLQDLSKLSSLKVTNNNLTGELPQAILDKNLAEFEWYQNHFLVHVSGRITDSNGQSFSGATVTVSGSYQTTTVTDQDGNYSVEIPDGYKYTLIPSKTGYSFQPAERTGTMDAELLGGLTLTDQDFTATLNTYTISGVVSRGETPLSGVSVNAGPGILGSQTTDVSGQYSFSGIPHGTQMTITPSKAGYSFTPTSQQFTVTSDITFNLNATLIDADGDGLGDLDEEARSTNPNNPDTDGDGVSDSEEIAIGTNPLDKGSAEVTRPATLCSEWNGYLGMYNALEHVNLATNGRKYTTTLYSLKGDAEAPVIFSIAGGGEYDLLVHDLNGFENDRYGKVCTTVTNGNSGELDGRMVFYKPDAASGGYQFAFAMPLGNGLSGTQYLPYNTYQPSLDPLDASNLAANWIQITNLSTSRQTGTLVFYNRDGTEVTRQEVALKAGARFDFSGHDLAGRSQVGLVEWMPTANTARFQLRSVRYYYRADGVTVPLGDDFDSAFQLEGIVGSGQVLTVPLDTENSSSVLELANTLNEEVKAEVSLYAETGGTALHHQTYKLKPHATYHLIADSILNGRQGIATVQGSKPASVIATAMQYGRTETLGIQTVYGIQASEPLGTTMRGSYNTFLKQDCRLLMVNPTSAATFATVTMRRYDGTDVDFGSVLKVSAHGLTDYDLCAQDQENVYGVVTVQPDTPNTIFATVLRIGESEQYRFPTPVRD